MSDPQRPVLAPGQLYRVAWIFYLILAITGVVWIGLDDRADGPCAGTGFCLGLFVDAQGWPIDLALGLGAALLVTGAWQLACRWLALARALEERLAQLVGGLRPDEAIAIALVSGFGEELFFRGAVQGSLGWLVATVVFALMHTGPGPAMRFWTVYAAIVGLLFAGLVEWRGTLLAAIVAHALINGIGLWRLSRRPGGDAGVPGASG